MKFLSPPNDAHPAPRRGGFPSKRCRGGFSLVEVTLAIGIVAFAFVAVLGLLPAGMQTADSAYEQGRATEILNTAAAAAAVAGQRALGVVAGNPNFAFGDWLSDADNPQTDPTKYFITQSPWEFADFYILESGTIRRKTDTSSPARYKLFLRVTPPLTDSEPVKVYLSVAWPGVAVWDTAKNQWKNHQGQVETFLYANLPLSN